MTIYKKLFKLNSDDKTVQVWELHKAYDNKSYWAVYGQLDGKKVVSGRTIVTPKVSRTQREQMILELEAKITNKRRKKYVEDVKGVGEKADKALPGYTAMLAKKWSDQKKKIEFPCLAQPKLDGVRCLATKDGFFTRGRKNIEACQHIFEDLKPFFKKNPKVQLDGELYTHEFKNDFEKIIKAVRKSSKHATDKDLKLQKKVQYHVYDVPRVGKYTEEDPYDVRRKTLLGLMKKVGTPKSVRFVPTIKIQNEKALLKRHAIYLEKGYEGTMVRNIAMVYKHGRSDNLLKMKEFDEQEFEIIEVHEGKGGLRGHAGTFVLKMKDGTKFRAKMEGSFERLKWIWEHPKSVVGKMCTVMYQGLTNKENVPRFPVAKSVRGLKDRSDWL